MRVCLFNVVPLFPPGGVRERACAGVLDASTLAGDSMSLNGRLVRDVERVSSRSAVLDGRAGNNHSAPFSAPASRRVRGRTAGSGARAAHSLARLFFWTRRTHSVAMDSTFSSTNGGGALDSLPLARTAGRGTRTRAGGQAI